MNIKDKVALITGAAKGIGKGCASVFAEAGAYVAVVDIDEKAGPTTVDEIREAGGKAQFFRCDVSKTEEVQALIRAVLEELGRIDILFNNAGYHISKNVEQTSEEEWDYIINTNLKSVFLCSKFAMPHLRETKGCIINTSSMVGIVGQSSAGAYAASKGGIVAMSKGMALDFAKDGIRVNCICPGWIQTPLSEDWFGQQDDPDAAREYIYSRHPFGRIGTVEECGRAALFLASSDAAFVTGVALGVDGGITLGY